MGHSLYLFFPFSILSIICREHPISFATWFKVNPASSLKVCSLSPYFFGVKGSSPPGISYRIRSPSSTVVHFRFIPSIALSPSTSNIQCKTFPSFVNIHFPISRGILGVQLLPNTFRRRSSVCQIRPSSSNQTGPTSLNSSRPMGNTIIRSCLTRFYFTKTPSPACPRTMLLCPTGNSTHRPFRQITHRMQDFLRYLLSRSHLPESWMAIRPWATCP